MVKRESESEAWTIWPVVAARYDALVDHARMLLARDAASREYEPNELVDVAALRVLGMGRRKESAILGAIKTAMMRVIVDAGRRRALHAEMMDPDTLGSEGGGGSDDRHVRAAIAALGARSAPLARLVERVITHRETPVQAGRHLGMAESTARHLWVEARRVLLEQGATKDRGA